MLPLNYEAYQHILTQALLKMYVSIKLNLDKAADTNQKYYDQKAHKREISVNDVVFLVNNKKGNKIQPDFIGPFIVTDVSNIDNNTVTIDAFDTPGRTQLVPIYRLKPFIPRPARDTFITEAGGSQCQQ
uniref:Uncharacterized protein n=1 Tax=Romanomermis culicivorax TaxID=13658 RepID=A0A915L2Y7_ROMCU